MSAVERPFIVITSNSYLVTYVEHLSGCAANIREN